MSLTPLSPEIKSEVAEIQRKKHVSDFEMASKAYNQWVDSLTAEKLTQGSSTDQSVNVKPSALNLLELNVPLVKQYLHDRYQAFSTEYVSDGAVKHDKLIEIVQAGVVDASEQQSFRSDSTNHVSEPHYYLGSVAALGLIVLFAWLLNVVFMKRRAYRDVLKHLLLTVLFPVPRLLSLGKFRIDWDKAFERRLGLLGATFVFVPGLFTTAFVYCAGLAVFPSSWESVQNHRNEKFLVTDLSMYSDLLKGKQGSALMPMVALTSQSWQRDITLKNKSFSDNHLRGSNVMWTHSIYSCDLMLDMASYAKEHNQSFGQKGVESVLAMSLTRWFSRDIASSSGLQTIADMTREFNNAFTDIPRGMSSFNDCYAGTNQFNQKQAFLAYMKSSGN